MSVRISIESLVALAGASKQEDDLAQYSKLPEGVREALKAEMEREREEASRDVAKSLVQVIKISESEKEKAVNRIRLLRAEVERMKTFLNRLDDAQELAESDGNFIPLCSTLGVLPHHEIIRLGQEKPELLEIPKKKVDSKKGKG